MMREVRGLSLNSVGEISRTGRRREKGRGRREKEKGEVTIVHPPYSEVKTSYLDSLRRLLRLEVYRIRLVGSSLITNFMLIGFSIFYFEAMWVNIKIMHEVSPESLSDIAFIVSFIFLTFLCGFFATVGGRGIWTNAVEFGDATKMGTFVKNEFKKRDVTEEKLIEHWGF